MLGSPTLLVVHEGKSGPFIKWLEDLGLGEFLKRYPLSLLIKWGWITPQYRVIFPKRFFETWVNYPFIPSETPSDLNDYSTLWGYSWDIDNTDTPLWFLDPIFHPDNVSGKLLKQFVYLDENNSPIPETFMHERGISITPYADYFYHWQGYQLIDIIRNSDIFEPIYLSPDALDRSQNVTRAIKSTISSISVTQCNHYWTNLKELMTGIQHLRSFKSALSASYEIDSKAQYLLYLEGANLLAKHFMMTPEILEKSIRGSLLVMAQEWIYLNSLMTRRSLWTMHAWKNFQADIQLAISWLLILSEKTLDQFIEAWSYPYMGARLEASIETVLPYEFFKHKQSFIKLSPTYLKDFNVTKNNNRPLNEETLPDIIQRIYKRNYPFAGFLSAFHELHQSLSYKSFDKNGLDFRSLRPLDQYTLMAIHAEGCLRRELDSLGLLNNIKPDDQRLSKYIQLLCKSRGISEKILGCFNSHLRLADLRINRQDPIGRIQSLNTKIAIIDKQIAQAFLCCVLARNYFAHHDFLDNELIHSDKSAFMLKGILLTVLLLLDADSS